MKMIKTQIFDEKQQEQQQQQQQQKCKKCFCKHKEAFFTMNPLY